MPAPKRFAWTFRNVCARPNGFAVMTAYHDSSMEKDKPVTSLMLWDGSGWKSQDSHPCNGTVFAMIDNPRTPMLLGKEGVVYHWLPKGGFTAEPIDPSDDGPQNFGDMQDLRVIGGSAYAAGMARTVYVREAAGTWTALDRDIRSSDPDEDVGFFSIDGFGKDEIYAVGLEGEIWHRDGKSWHPVASPTNLMLHRVLCAPDGKVYACGQGGIILAGRGNAWQVIEQEATEETFWGSAWFDDRLFLSTAEGIYTLSHDQVESVAIEPVAKKKISTTKGLSFYRLDSADGFLWSVGSKAAMWTKDGVHWQEVTY